ncbi:hypothetical protein TYRP_012495 [Tyrophagus putrescentiae]|nr:hypothetical protein TYRP_012495 [Tyrophagus putrescentiae]
MAATSKNGLNGGRLAVTMMDCSSRHGWHFRFLRWVFLCSHFGRPSEERRIEGNNSGKLKTAAAAAAAALLATSTNDQ